MKGNNSLQKAGLVLLIGFLLTASVLAAGGRLSPARALPQIVGIEQVRVRVNNWGVNNTVSLSYQVPQLSLTTSTVQVAGVEKVENCSMGNAVPVYNEGEPVLPVIFAKVMLPQGHTVADIVVSRGKAIPVAGKHFIEFGPAHVALMPGAKARKAVPKAEIYNSNAPFPKTSYKLVTVQKKRGVTFAFLQVYPVTYFPKSQKLEYYTNITVQVRTKPASPVAGNGIRVRLEGMKKMCREVENIELLNTYQDGVLRGPAQFRICNPAEEFKWVFVTSEAIKNATNSPNVTDLEQHRKSQGFTTKIMTVEEILNKYEGVDNAEKLRKFITEAYNNWKTEFIVLGGDINVVPHRQLYCYVSPENVDEIDSDLYFQCLDGNYNYDNDELWGESDDGHDYENVDMMAELNIGRISAGNATEMANAIFKIMAYENTPGDDAFLTKALMLGEDLGWQGVMEYAKPSLLQIVNGVDSLNLKGFAAAPEFTVDGLYEADGSYSKTDVKNKINSASYSIIHHFGHSNSSYGMKLRNGDEDDLTNEKFSFGYSQGCLTGQFSKDCLGERVTTSTRTGFWGIMFNTNLGFGYQNNIDGPSQMVAREFWDAYFAEDMKYVSALNQDSHEDNLPNVGSALIQWSIYETNILGDPATKIRGKIVPAFITVTAPNGGEKWEQGRAFEITWNDNITENVKIEVIKGTAVQQELAASEPSDGSFTWNIASDFPLGADYKIRVTSTTSGALVDESFDFFAVEAQSNLSVMTPNGGETVTKGSQYELKWSDNLSGNVNIDLYKDDAFSRPIVMGTESDGSYMWTVSDLIAKGSGYKIRVTSVDKEWLFDESDAVFSFDNPIITNFPYIVNFDHFEEGTGPLGSFWEQIEGDDDFNWTTQTGPTPSGTTGPDADHTSGSGKYIFTEASGDGNPNKKFHAITPVLDLPNVTDFQMSFWCHMRSDTNRMGNLYVDIFSDGSWNDGVVTIEGQQGVDWVYKSFDLASYADKQIQFRFRGVTDTAFDSDMAIDDFRVGGPTSIHTFAARLPHSFDMRYYGSHLHFQIPKNGANQQHVSINLYNIQGKLVRTLVDGTVKVGYHAIPVNTSHNGKHVLASGVYLCKINTKGYSKTIDLIIRK